MPIHVRLKPHNPPEGYTARAISFAHIGGVLFEEGKIVESIDGRPIAKATADYLRTVRVKQDDSRTPLAFDVLEADEMKAKVLAESKRKLGLSPEVMNALRDEFGAEPKSAPPPTRQPRRQRAEA